MADKDYKVIQMAYMYHLYRCKSVKDFIRLIITKRFNCTKEEFKQFQELREKYF